MTDYTKLLAKSNPNTTLVDHTKMVIHIAMHLFDRIWKKNIFNVSSDKEVRCLLAVSCILHDIGKATDAFQEMIGKNARHTSITEDGVEYDKRSKGKNDTKNPRHHLISWAVATCLKKYDDEHRVRAGGGDHIKPTDIISSSVLYHHVVPDSYFSDKLIDSSSIIENLTVEEFDVIKRFYEEMIRYVDKIYPELSLNIGNDDRYELNNSNSSRQLNKEYLFLPMSERHDTTEYRYDAERSIIRACLIFADRTVSSSKYNQSRILANDTDYIDSMLDNDKMSDTFTVSREVLSKKFDLSNETNKRRFDEQYEIATSAEHNCRLFANAGYGKTLVALMRILTSKKKTIWVAPTNNICISNYQSITSELERMGIMDKVRVGLYYAGEYKESSDNYFENEDYDILVTNIDTILNYHIKNNSAHLLYKLYSYNMVIDEYHEFFNTKPLFNGFIRLLNTRLRHTIGTGTLLMSATPKDFDMFGLTENLLHTHQCQVHNGDMEILIRIHDNVSPLTIRGLIGEDSFLFTNTIKQSQDYYCAINGDYPMILCHSWFTEGDIKRIFDDVRKTHGKKSDEDSKKIVVVSTGILGTGHDISARNIYDFILSPDSTIQRGCGRGGRFNEPQYNGLTTYNVLLEGSLNKGATQLIDGVCGTELRDKWIECLRKLDGTRIKKRELYDIFFKFQLENKEKYTELYKRFFNESTDEINAFHPKSVYKIKNETDVKYNGNGASWRGENNGIFVVARCTSTDDDWSEPISVSSERILYKENDETTHKNIRKEYIENHQNEYADVMSAIKYGRRKKVSDRYRAEVLAEYAYRSDRPLPLASFAYDPQLGLIYIG